MLAEVEDDLIYDTNIFLNKSYDLYFRLTEEKSKEEVLGDGRILLLEASLLELQSEIEETAAEVRRKNYDKYKLHGMVNEILTLILF